MSRRSYTDIDAEVLLRLANRTDITSGQRGFFINDAYLMVAIMFTHKEIQKISPSEALSQGSDNFTPAVTDVWFPTAMRNQTDGYIIRQESLERAERAQTKPTSRPYTYYWYGGTFYFEAFADTAKTIKLWYKRKPVDIVIGNGSELDQLFDPLIIMEAARMGLETVRDFDEAGKQEQSFLEYVKKNKIPMDQAKLNDYRQGWRVRFK